MRVLGGGPERVALAAAIVRADRSARLYGARREAIVDELERCDMGGGGEGGLDRLGVAEPPIVGDVAPEFLVHQRRPCQGGGREVRHRGERLPRDIDRRGSVGGRMRVFGHDERNRIAHVARLIRGEDRPAGERHRRAVVGGDVPQHVGIAAAIPAPVLPGEHGQHAWHGARALGGNRPDAGMGVRTAHEGGVCLPRAGYRPRTDLGQSETDRLPGAYALCRHAPCWLPSSLRPRPISVGRLVSRRAGVHPNGAGRVLWWDGVSANRGDRGC